jgi:hypothetical protein
MIVPTTSAVEASEPMARGRDCGVRDSGLEVREDSAGGSGLEDKGLLRVSVQIGNFFTSPERVIILGALRDAY